MYVGRAKRGRSGLAGAHKVSRLRGIRRLGQDDSSINWGTILDTGIVTAGQVAAVALKPPTYSSVVNPYTGAQTITSYGTAAPTISGSLLGSGTDLSSLLTSPLVLLGGLALVAVLALKK